MSNPPESSPVIDRGGAVRKGEELPVDTLDDYLKQHIPNLTGSPDVTQYSGGASNWTYRLAYASHDLILRRPPAGTKARGAHDMGREYRLQTALAPVFPHIAPQHLHCTDDSIIGAEFYVMDRLRGIIPRRHMPRGVDLSTAQARQLNDNFLDTLVALHAVDYQAIGLDAMYKGAGYARRQIEGWNARYAKARTWNVPRARGVMRWLSAHIPEDAGACVIHNDYRLDNVVLSADDPTRLIGVLDWELATVGCPMMDLGTTMAYWIQGDDGRFLRNMSRQPSQLPGMYDRDAMVAAYCERTGRDLKAWPIYEVYGLFRLAVILQQIYYRYHHKQTDNPAFKNFWLMVHFLVHRSKRIIRRSGI